MPFLIAIGDLPNDSMGNISKKLSIHWGGELIRISTNQCPNEAISSLPSENVLVEMIGDVGMLHSSGGSWLEALGSWKIPVILFVSPNSSGKIPGIAASYVALCKYLSVPLVGIVQLGGAWNNYDRRLDALPWCGFLPTNLLKKEGTTQSNYYIKELVSKLKIKFNNTY